MADIIPNIFLKDQAEKHIDFVADTMKVALLSGTYDNCKLREKNKYDDISADEISQHYGYVSGGFNVYHKTVTVDTKTDSVLYDMGDVGMTVSGGTLGPVRYGALYDLSNDNHLVYLFDFGEDKMVNDGASFKIKIDDGGLMKAKQFVDPSDIDSSCKNGCVN